MPESFISGIGSKLADQVLVQLYTPAYLFWVGGIAFYAHANWIWLNPELAKLPEASIVILAGAWLLLVTASAAIGQRFEPGIIRLLEGYHWPNWLKRLLVQRFQQRRSSQADIYQVLAPKVFGNEASREQIEQFTRADLHCHNIPPNPADVMPTKLGNVLQSAERRIQSKYGLDPRICWSRLWAVISKDDRDELSAARAALDIGARTFLWGGLFAIWTIWSWWALVIAVAVVLMSYTWMVNAADQYGELLEAAFDMFRFSLYKALNIDPPTDSQSEAVLGKCVTEYLWRGTGNITFSKPPSVSG